VFEDLGALGNLHRVIGDGGFPTFEGGDLARGVKGGVVLAKEFVSFSFCVAKFAFNVEFELFEL
jgi:hypothetical protein